MSSLLRGMARLTHVPEPMTRLGDQPSDERPRHPSVVGLFASLPDFKHQIGQPRFRIPAVGIGVALSICAFAMAPSWQLPVEKTAKLDDREFVRAEMLAADLKPRTTAQRMTVALAKRPLPKTIAPIHSINAEPQQVPSVGPDEVVEEVSDLALDVAGVQAVVISGLTDFVSLSSGVALGVGLWAVRVEEFASLRAGVSKASKRAATLWVDVPQMGKKRARAGRVVVQPGTDVSVKKKFTRVARRKKSGTWKKPSALGASPKKAPKKKAAAKPAKPAQQVTKKKVRVPAAPENLFPFGFGTAPLFGTN